MTSETGWKTISIQMAGFGAASIDWGDGTPFETHSLLIFDDEDDFEEIWHHADDRELKYGYYHTYDDDSARNITITGENITHLFCFNLCLTKLDVSKNVALFSDERHVIAIIAFIFAEKYFCYVGKN